MRALVAAAVAVAVLGGACELLPGPDLERMIDQPSARPFEASPFFADGRAMRAPPAGTIARGRVLGKAALTEGVVEGTYATEVPLPLGRGLLERGRNRFELFCATCHGVAGGGVSAVASNMELRKPPSLVDERAAAFPPGRVFHVISVGYGLMRAYADELPTDDRWAVVAYWQVLARSQRVRLAALPPGLRAEAERALR